MNELIQAHSYEPFKCRLILLVTQTTKRICCRFPPSQYIKIKWRLLLQLSSLLYFIDVTLQPSCTLLKNVISYLLSKLYENQENILDFTNIDLKFNHFQSLNPNIYIPIFLTIRILKSAFVFFFLSCTADIRMCFCINLQISSSAYH